MDAAEDAARLRAVAAGDGSAFAQLVDAHAPRLLRFARLLLGNEAEADDLVQDAFLGLWQAAGRWRPEARISTWLHRVVYNGAVDRIRRRRAFVDVALVADLPDPELPAPDSGLLRSETVASVRAALAALPERQRTAVLLYHFQELGQAEAADVMGIGEHAFESLLARGRRALRSALSAGGTDRNGDPA
ncbi:sigma-70 family RNA polymerase sigma factor [Propylenella binzhouense]|uniref:Sigma-70 family RNA polymerase sigma factor n=1 Tax=Propylenella binzhouense TaxID=2555902 RepID=A0A964T9C5_9HYPH|nr:sigma-70 family RNA polymerase sigma factor [Propylenella binzhouense]